MSFTENTSVQKRSHKNNTLFAARIDYELHAAAARSGGTGCGKERTAIPSLLQKRRRCDGGCKTVSGTIGRTIVESRVELVKNHTDDFELTDPGETLAANLTQIDLENDDD